MENAVVYQQLNSGQNNTTQISSNQMSAGQIYSVSRPEQSNLINILICLIVLLVTSICWLVGYWAGMSGIFSRG